MRMRAEPTRRQQWARKRRRAKLRKQLANFELRDHTFWYALVVIYAGAVVPPILLAGLDGPSSGSPNRMNAHVHESDAHGQHEMEPAAVGQGSVADSENTSPTHNTTSAPSQTRLASFAKKKRMRSGARAASRILEAAYESLVALRPLFAAGSVTLFLFSLARRGSARSSGSGCAGVELQRRDSAY
jgi:hypothetical protein